MVNISGSGLVLGGLVFLAVTCCVVALAVLWEMLRARRQRTKVNRALNRLQMAPAAAGKQEQNSLLRQEGQEVPDWLAPFAARVRHLSSVQILIEQADLEWTVQTYLVRSAGFALAAGLALLIITGSWLFAIVGAAVGAVSPYFYIRQKRKKRMESFQQQLPEAIDLLKRAIQAGHPISSGLKMVADESPEPVAGEFRRVFEEQRFGMPFDTSLLGLADRVPLVDVRIFITAVLVQREVGGNLAEILDKLSYVIRERFKILGQLRVYTAQGRLSGYILAVLPLAVGGFFFAMQPEMMLNYLRAPIGQALIAFALFLQGLGVMWIRKIVNIEV